MLCREAMLTHRTLLLKLYTLLVASNKTRRKLRSEKEPKKFYYQIVIKHEVSKESIYFSSWTKSVKSLREDPIFLSGLILNKVCVYGRISTECALLPDILSCCCEMIRNENFTLSNVKGRKAYQSEMWLYSPR